MSYLRAIESQDTRGHGRSSLRVSSASTRPPRAVGLSEDLWRGCRPRQEIDQQHNASDRCQQQRAQEDRDHGTRSCSLPYLDRLSARSIDRFAVIHRDLPRIRHMVYPCRSRDRFSDRHVEAGTTDIWPTPGAWGAFRWARATQRRLVMVVTDCITEERLYPAEA